MNRSRQSSFSVNIVRIAALLVVLACRPLRAQIPSPVPESVVGVEQQRESLLLLKTGRILKGTVQHSPNGYVVRAPSGHVVVPFDLVRFQAQDLEDAYRKLAASLPYPTASQHMTLAQWCLIHELFDEARNELEQALRLEPQRESARTMLRRLVAVMGDSTSANDGETKTSVDVAAAPEIRSLAGLPREEARTYVRTIQPLLMNKCASASCHGPEAPNDFRLMRIHPGQNTHRVFVERNLASVLKRIDRKDPAASPLLVRATDNHGARGHSHFTGPYGGKQIASLRKWVLAVAESEASMPSDRAGSDTLELVSHTASSSMSHAAAPSGDRQAAPGATSDPRKTKPPIPAAKDEPTLEELLRERQRDAFDPNAFNLKPR